MLRYTPSYLLQIQTSEQNIVKINKHSCSRKQEREISVDWSKDISLKEKNNGGANKVQNSLSCEVGP